MGSTATQTPTTFSMFAGCWMPSDGHAEKSMTITPNGVVTFNKPNSPQLVYDLFPSTSYEGAFTAIGRKGTEKEGFTYTVLISCHGDELNTVWIASNGKRDTRKFNKLNPTHIQPLAGRWIPVDGSSSPQQITIETDKKYLLSFGVKFHNCDGSVGPSYDLTYLSPSDYSLPAGMVFHAAGMAHYTVYVSLHGDDLEMVWVTQAGKMKFVMKYKRDTSSSKPKSDLDPITNALGLGDAVKEVQPKPTEQNVEKPKPTIEELKVKFLGTGAAEQNVEKPWPLRFYGSDFVLSKEQISQLLERTWIVGDEISRVYYVTADFLTVDEMLTALKKVTDDSVTKTVDRVTTEQWKKEIDAQVLKQAFLPDGILGRWVGKHGDECVFLHEGVLTIQGKGSPMTNSFTRPQKEEAKMAEIPMADVLGRWVTVQEDDKVKPGYGPKEYVITADNDGKLKLAITLTDGIRHDYNVTFTPGVNPCQGSIVATTTDDRSVTYTGRWFRCDVCKDGTTTEELRVTWDSGGGTVVFNRVTTEQETQPNLRVDPSIETRRSAEGPPSTVQAPQQAFLPDGILGRWVNKYGYEYVFTNDDRQRLTIIHPSGEKYIYNVIFTVYNVSSGTLCGTWSLHEGVLTIQWKGSPITNSFTRPQKEEAKMAENTKAENTKVDVLGRWVTVQEDDKVKPGHGPKEYVITADNDGKLKLTWYCAGGIYNYNVAFTPGKMLSQGSINPCQGSIVLTSTGGSVTHTGLWFRCDVCKDGTTTEELKIMWDNGGTATASSTSGNICYPFGRDDCCWPNGIPRRTFVFNRDPAWKKYACLLGRWRTGNGYDYHFSYDDNGLKLVASNGTTFPPCDYKAEITYDTEGAWSGTIRISSPLYGKYDGRWISRSVPGTGEGELEIIWNISKDKLIFKRLPTEESKEAESNAAMKKYACLLGRWRTGDGYDYHFSYDNGLKLVASNGTTFPPCNYKAEITYDTEDAWSGTIRIRSLRYGKYDGRWSISRSVPGTGEGELEIIWDISEVKLIFKRLPTEGSNAMVEAQLPDESNEVAEPACDRPEIPISSQEQKRRTDGMAQFTFTLNGGKVFKTFLLASIVSGVFWVGTRVWNGWVFDANFSNYLKKAVLEKNQDRAIKYADRAVCYLKERGMCDGRTDVLLDDGPEADLAEFYEDVQKCVSAIKRANSAEERKDIDIPTPPGGLCTAISLYPVNKGFFYWLLSTIGASLIGGIGMSWGAVRKRQQQS